MKYSWGLCVCGEMVEGLDGLEVMQGYGCWCMEVCLMRKWRDIWLVGFIVKMLQNNGQVIHMCDTAEHFFGWKTYRPSRFIGMTAH